MKGRLALIAMVKLIEPYLALPASPRARVVQLLLLVVVPAPAVMLPIVVVADHSWYTVIPSVATS